MSNTILINPNWSYEGAGIFNRMWPPLSLAICASIFEEQGRNPTIIDAQAMDYSPTECVDEIGEAENIFITSSTLDKWQCPHFSLTFLEELIPLIRERNPEAAIYLIGAHGTVKPDWTMNKLSPDYVVKGEPEKPLQEIAKDRDPREVAGVSYMEEGGIVDNPLGEPVELDSLPKPAYHLLPMDRYHYEIMGDRFALLEGSRGCPYNCIFCLQKMFNGYRRKSAGKLISEIDYLVDEFGVENLYFIDLEFTVNRELVEKVCHHLVEKDYGLNWCCQTRADTVDKKMLDLMKEAGCTLIHYGVETGSPEIMDSINKNTSLDDIRKGVQLTHQAGIETACFFMFGFPGESRQQMEETIDFAVELNPTYASFHSAAPYPGTDLSSSADKGFPLNIDEHSFEALRGMVKKAFLRFYLRPGYIFSRLRDGDPSSWIRQILLFTRYLRKNMI